MREYLLLLPIIFIFHDMEEIIGFGWFFRNNPEIFKRFPIIAKAYKDFTTAGMALAVYEEFIPSLITSIICLPVTVIILIKSSQYIAFNLSTILLMVAGILFMIANLKFAHWLMHKFGKQLG